MKIIQDEAWREARGRYDIATQEFERAEREFWKLDSRVTVRRWIYGSVLVAGLSAFIYISWAHPFQDGWALVAILTALAGVLLIQVDSFRLTRRGNKVTDAHLKTLYALSDLQHGVIRQAIEGPSEVDKEATR